MHISNLNNWELEVHQSSNNLAMQLPYYRRTAIYTTNALSAKGGFTLIELLVVVAIIGLLSSVVLVALNNSRAKSRDAKRIADMNQVTKAMELYFNSYNSYPTTATSTNFSSNPTIGQPGLAPTFLTRLPSAPIPPDGSNCGVTGATGNGVNDYYMYANVGGSQNVTTTYSITFCLGAKTGALGPGPHTITQAGMQ